MGSLFDNGGFYGTSTDLSNFEKFVVDTQQLRVRPVYVGSQSYSRPGSTIPVNQNFDLNGGIGNAPATDDIVILSICHGTSVALPPSAPSGYTAIANLSSSDTYDVALSVSYKIMGSTPDTTFPIPSSLNSTNAQCATVFVWRGVDLTTPMDVSPQTATGLNGRNPNPPGITPTTLNSIVMATGAAGHTGGASLFSSNLENFRRTGSNDTYDSSIGTGSYTWTSGSYNPSAFTGTSVTTDAWASVTFALRAGLQNFPVYGNRKNSGIWSLNSAYDDRSTYFSVTFDEYLDTGFSYYVSSQATTDLFLPTTGSASGDRSADGGTVEVIGVGETDLIVYIRNGNQSATAMSVNGVMYDLTFDSTVGAGYDLYRNSSPPSFGIDGTYSIKIA
jgi:hypothetical protein